MKKIKDVFYDLNDILVALVIVALAALVIVSNIDTILAYPSGVAAEVQLPEEETPTDYADNPPISDQGNGNTIGDQGSNDAVEDQGATGSGVDVGTGGQGTSEDSGKDQDGGGSSGNPGSGEVENYSVYINPGSTGDQIADLMISVGLFKDRQQFNDAVTAAGKDGKLRAGNFIIPSNATPAEVIAIITK